MLAKKNHARKVAAESPNLTHRSRAGQWIDRGQFFHPSGGEVKFILKNLALHLDDGDRNHGDDQETLQEENA
jgi:hypothetical protein